MRISVLVAAWLIVAAMLFVLIRRARQKYRETGSLFLDLPETDPGHSIIRQSDGLWGFRLTGTLTGTGGAVCMHSYFWIGLPLLAAGLLMFAIGSALRRKRRATEL
jgi:hypothetical protein